MKEQLQRIYPAAVFSQQANPDPSVISLPVESGFLEFAKKDLSKEEVALLTLLMPLKTSEAAHPWHQILFDKQPAPKGSYRVLQFRILKDSDFDLKTWEENLQEMFPQVADRFYLENGDLLLIEKESKTAFDQQTLAGIFLSLDADFNTKTYLFVGRFFSQQEPVTSLFQEERKIFLEELPYLKERRTFSLADVALHYFTKDSFSQSSLIRFYQDQLGLDEEMGKIIQTLWHNQGNISSTAKELFLHRNTLQYRIDKFQEKSGINLKNTDQLIFCYLLSTH